MLVLKDICWRVPEKEILDSVSLTVPDGKLRGRHRPQRRRQDQPGQD